MTVLAKWQKAFIPNEFLDVSVICITDCDPDIQCTSPMKYVNVVLLCVCAWVVWHLIHCLPALSRTDGE